MDRVKTPGTDIEISALCLGVAEIGVRQTETNVSRLKRTETIIKEHIDAIN
jgi:aryl-alcohol dehydrogenase-like predicted oxidoreductase